jgi:hypothetical protein
VARLLDVVRGGGYDGLEVNYEHLALTTDPRVAATVRDAYSHFARELCAALHAEGRQCVHTVMPRTDDSSAVWRGKLIPAVYDYRAIGAVADRVRVMAYDQHAPGTAPGPIAGWPWATAVADYTRATLPPGKGELGIPLYGRDWPSSGANTTTVTDPGARALAREHGAVVRWDEVQRAPTFTYAVGTARRTVWFSDARSVTERVALARSRGLGAAYWVPSQEDPATWGGVRAAATARFWDTVGGEVQRAVEAVAARGITRGRRGRRVPPDRRGHPGADGLVPVAGAVAAAGRRAGPLLGHRGHHARGGGRRRGRGRHRRRLPRRDVPAGRGRHPRADGHLPAARPAPRAVLAGAVHRRRRQPHEPAVCAGRRARHRTRARRTAATARRTASREGRRRCCSPAPGASDQRAQTSDDGRAAGLAHPTCRASTARRLTDTALTPGVVRVQHLEGARLVAPERQQRGGVQLDVVGAEAPAVGADAVPLGGEHPGPRVVGGPADRPRR